MGCLPLVRCVRGAEGEQAREAECVEEANGEKRERSTAVRSDRVAESCSKATGRADGGVTARVVAYSGREWRGEEERKRREGSSEW